MESQPTDEHLMRLAQDGDRSAFATLFRRYAPPVLGYLARLSGDRHLAENVCQETFMRLYERRAQYKPAAPVRPYIYTIARNLLRNEQRRNLAEPVDPIAEPAAPAADPADQTEQRARLERLDRAMRLLSPASREIIVLRCHQELPYREIAEILDEPEGTLRSRYTRALADLGGRIGED